MMSNRHGRVCVCLAQRFTQSDLTRGMEMGEKETGAALATERRTNLVDTAAMPDGGRKPEDDVVDETAPVTPADGPKGLNASNVKLA